MNNICLIGRIGNALELKSTGSDIKYVSFNLAVDRGRKDANGERITDWIPCKAWRGTAEFICRYFGKGSTIAIAGELQTRKYQDKDGNNRTAFEVSINNAYFCGGKNDGASGGNANTGGDYPLLPGDEPLPF